MPHGVGSVCPPSSSAEVAWSEFNELLTTKLKFVGCGFCVASKANPSVLTADAATNAAISAESVADARLVSSFISVTIFSVNGDTAPRQSMVSLLIEMTQMSAAFFQLLRVC